MPASTYGPSFSQTDMENLVGVGNVAEWSNPTGYQTGQAANPTVVQAAINWASAEIYTRFRNTANYSYPLAPNGPSSPTLTAEWGIKLACWRLRAARGFRDDAERKQYDWLMVPVYAEMGEYLSGQKFLDAGQRWPQNSGPAAVR